MKLYSIMLFTVFPLFVRGQVKNLIPADISQKISDVNRHIKMLNAYNPFTDSTAFDIETANDSIATSLIDLLKDHRSMTPAVDQQLKEILITTSADKMMKIFAWDQRTGGSFNSYCNIIQYKTPTGVVSTYEFSETDCAASLGNFTRIQKLPNHKTNLYLAFQNTVGCNTCEENMATVFQISNDRLLTNYPAFEENSACFSIYSRSGSMEVFTFDPKKQTLRIRYIKDDLTDGSDYFEHHPNEEKVNLLFLFDGTKFKRIRNSQ